MDVKGDRIAIFDIETNGLLLDVTKFWVGYVFDKKENRYFQFRDAEELVRYLNTCDVIVGHNIIGYDIPALNKLSKTKVRGDIKIVDTLLLSKLAFYNKDNSFGHSLEDWGLRMGYEKGTHSDWSQYSDEMDKYCKRDVAVTLRLYNHLLKKSEWLPYSALELEQEVQKVITQQHIHGWVFDVQKAQQLHIELLNELEEAERKLFSVFKPLLYKKGTVTTPKKPFRRYGWYTVGPKQRIEVTPFNPSSGSHIVHWVEVLYGKQEWELTEKGNPKTDADTLKEMFTDKDWAEPLLHYMEVKKLLGQLAEGDKAWLKLVRNDGRIHGSADILGAVTGRFTHSNPNMAQIPSKKAYKGEESRQLFTVPKGYKLVGADASGLELRTLSHYLSKHDNGKYGKIVLEGDVHTANQNAAGLPTRDAAKTFIYAFLYGAGDAKIGKIVNGTKKEGRRLKQIFTKKTDGLDKLINGVKKAAKRGYLVGLSKRRLFVRSQHSALNTLLQSAGAYYMKYFLVEANKRLKEGGYDYHFVGNIHDEVQLEVKDDQAEEVAKLLEQTFIDVGKQIGMRLKMEGEAKIGNNWAETH